MSKLGRLPVLGLLVALSGCGELESEDERKGEFLVLSGSRVCQGTFLAMDRQVAETAQRIHLDLPESPLRVTLRRSYADAEEACVGASVDEGGVTLGCAGGLESGTWIETTPAAFGHEVVHGLRRQQGLNGPSWFEEGIAEWVGWGAFDTSVTTLALPLDGPVLALESLEETRAAQHYFAWLSVTQGLPLVADYMNEPEFLDPFDETETLSLFEAYFGITLDESYAEYATADPGELRPSTFCRDEETVLLEDGAVVGGRFDCEGSSQTFGFEEDETTSLGRKCVWAIEDASYEVLLSGPEGTTLTMTSTDCEQEEDGYEMEFLEAGVHRAVSFRPCKWSMFIEAPRGAEGDASVSFSRG